MSLFHLSKLVGSKEDFADAHEPLNDGVKEVPNAQTVAAGTKTGDVGTDTNSQGPAKVIPEKEDTDDKTEKQFDTVKESAEKGGAKPAADKPAADTQESKPTPPPAKSDDSSKDTKADSGDGATKPPPFVKKDDAEESEAKADEPELEHDTAEATDAEIKKTESATKSLEDYSQHAGRFDIIGYPRRDQERLRNTIGFINRRAGKPSTVTKLSLECISEAVTTGKARLETLRAQAAVHATRKVSKENYDAVVEQAITTEPTAHGNEPLDPAAAAQMTELETNPMDLPEVAEIGRIQDAVDTLQGAQVAIEQHLQILRSNKRISKQAAAVLQAGLEHIDQICGLKVRATGMEGYLTTPRAAVEDADVNEKSLLDRAGEIGAKILNWLIKMLEKVETMTLKYSEGIVEITNRFQRIKDSINGGTLPEVVLKVANKRLFHGDDFVGDKLTREESIVPRELRKNRTEIMSKVIKPLLAILRSGPASEEMAERVRELKAEFNSSGTQSIELPGGTAVQFQGLVVRYNQEYDSNFQHYKTESKKDVEVPPMFGTVLRKNVDEIITYLDDLTDTSTAMAMLDAGSQIKSAIISVRGKSKDVDEGVFQKVQSEVMGIVTSALHQRIYFGLLGDLADAQIARATYFEMRLRNDPDTGNDA